MGNLDHCEINQMLMKVRAQEMRVVSSYGPNITLKVLQRHSLKY